MCSVKENGDATKQRENRFQRRCINEWLVPEVIIIDSQEEEIIDDFPKLSNEQVSTVNKAMRGGSKQEVN